MRRPKKKTRTQDAGTAERPLFVPDPEVQQDLREVGRLRQPKPKKGRLSDAQLSGGDVDSMANDAGSGEEAVGGTAATPDQDIVEELGKAVGVTYQDNEPLQPVSKVKKRDRKRWELNPSSSEDYHERKERTS